MKLKEDIKLLNLDLKKEIILIIINALLLLGDLIFLFLSLNSLFRVLFSIFLLILICSSYSLRIQYKKARLEIKKQSEIVEFFSYYKSFLSENINVYNAFKLCLIYSSDWLKSKILNLLSTIDNDKTIKPYLEFSSEFKNLNIQSVMIAIYQLDINGYSKARLDNLIYLLQEMNINEYHNRKSSYEDSYNSIFYICISSALIYSFLLIYNIVIMMGSLINGI